MGRAAALERRAWDRLLERLPDFELRIVRRGFEVAREGLARYDDAVSLALVRAAARRAGLVLGIRAARQLVELARRTSGRRLPLGRGWGAEVAFERLRVTREIGCAAEQVERDFGRSEEHTSELQSLAYLVCRLLLEKKKK